MCDTSLLFMDAHIWLCDVPVYLLFVRPMFRGQSGQDERGDNARGFVLEFFFFLFSFSVILWAHRLSPGKGTGVNRLTKSGAATLVYHQGHSPNILHTMMVVVVMMM